MKEVFAEATKLSNEKHSVLRNAKGWQKNFTRIEQQYSTFIAKVKQSGRDRDDEDLHNTPEYYKAMHEWERGKSCHDPPAQLLTYESIETKLVSTSTGKRLKTSRNETLQQFIEKQDTRHAEIISELKRSNDEREKTRSILPLLVSKL